MQIYLPEDLYDLVKARGLPASELLQRAVRAEVRRLDLLSETDKYVTKLIAEVGSPSTGDRDRARSMARRLERHSSRRAG